MHDQLLPCGAAILWSLHVQKPLPVRVQSPRNTSTILQDAVYSVLGIVFSANVPHAIPTALQNSKFLFSLPMYIKESCTRVVHLVIKETVTKNKKLIDRPLLCNDWMKVMYIELGWLAQGVKDTKGTDTIRFMALNKIPNIPQCNICNNSCRLLVAKDIDPNRVSITVGSNLSDYPGKLTTWTVDLTTSKVMWNSVISTPKARFICADVKMSIFVPPW